MSRSSRSRGSDGRTLRRASRARAGYIAKFRADYNLDKPLIVQYLLYMGNLVQGDLGTNFFGNKVIDELAARWPDDAQARH